MFWLRGACVWLFSSVFFCFLLFSPVSSVFSCSCFLLFSSVFFLLSHVFFCFHLFSPVFFCFLLLSPVFFCFLLFSSVFVHFTSHWSCKDVPYGCSPRVQPNLPPSGLHACLQVSSLTYDEGLAMQMWRDMQQIGSAPNDALLGFCGRGSTLCKLAVFFVGWSVGW